MKKLFYKFIGENEGLSESLSKDSIGYFLEKSSPRSSCWWSKLKTSANGIANMFDAYGDGHERIFKGLEPNGFPNLTIKKCPAIQNILTNSFLIKSPTDMVITVSSTGDYLIDATNNQLSITSHPTEQFYTKTNNIFKDKISLKFDYPISLKCNGIPWIFLKPTYHNNIDLEVLNGVINTKLSTGQPLNVNFLVDIPKTGFTRIDIKAGDVLAYLWLPESVSLKYHEQPILDLFRTKWTNREA